MLEKESTQDLYETSDNRSLRSSCGAYLIDECLVVYILHIQADHLCRL
jgi:hypothetical protein